MHLFRPEEGVGEGLFLREKFYQDRHDAALWWKEKVEAQSKSKGNGEQET